MNKIKILFLEIAGRFLGVDLDYVKEVLEQGNIHPLPLAPFFVSGIINRRGKFICIVNLIPLLELPQDEVKGDSRIIVFEHPEMDVGILVNRVIGTRLASLPEQAENSGRSHDYKGEWLFQAAVENQTNEDKVSILDLERLFTFFKEGNF